MTQLFVVNQGHWFFLKLFSHLSPLKHHFSNQIMNIYLKKEALIFPITELFSLVVYKRMSQIFKTSAIFNVWPIINNTKMKIFFIIDASH